MATVSVSDLAFNVIALIRILSDCFITSVVYNHQADVMTRLKLFAVGLGSLGPGLVVMLLGLLKVVNLNIGL